MHVFGLSKGLELTSHLDHLSSRWDLPDSSDPIPGMRGKAFNGCAHADQRQGTVLRAVGRDVGSDRAVTREARPQDPRLGAGEGGRPTAGARPNRPCELRLRPVYRLPVEGGPARVRQWRYSHLRFQQWERSGVARQMWGPGLAKYDDLEGIAWRWQAVGGALRKAPRWRGHWSESEGSGERMHAAPARSGRYWFPAPLVVSGLKVNDHQGLPEVLSGPVVRWPWPRSSHPQHLCTDKGYD
jgi:hypothetical protein